MVSKWAVISFEYSWKTQYMSLNKEKKEKEQGDDSQVGIWEDTKANC